MRSAAVACSSRRTAPATATPSTSTATGTACSRAILSAASVDGSAPLTALTSSSRVNFGRDIRIAGDRSRRHSAGNRIRSGLIGAFGELRRRRDVDIGNGVCARRGGSHMPFASSRHGKTRRSSSTERWAVETSMSMDRRAARHAPFENVEEHGIVATRYDQGTAPKSSTSPQAAR